ncbi:unnamed protein product, partial [Ascophyllum nodosum]
ADRFVGEAVVAATGVRGGDGESKVNVTLEELKRVILGGDAITLDTLLSSQVGFDTVEELGEKRGGSGGRKEGARSSDFCSLKNVLNLNVDLSFFSIAVVKKWRV